jgi:hypothetical protein
MVGERILDRFLIEERIGSGGLAPSPGRDERLQRSVRPVSTEHGAPGSPGRCRRWRAAHRNIATYEPHRGEGLYPS